MVNELVALFDHAREVVFERSFLILLEGFEPSGCQSSRVSGNVGLQAGAASEIVQATSGFP